MKDSSGCSAVDIGLPPKRRQRLRCSRVEACLLCDFIFLGSDFTCSLIFPGLIIGLLVVVFIRDPMISYLLSLLI
jgi:hypothetical protein